MNNLNMEITTHPQEPLPTPTSSPHLILQNKNAIKDKCSYHLNHIKI